MKTKIINIILVITFITISCDNKKESTYYNNLRQKYNPIFVSHFPKTIEKGHIDITENGEYDVTRLFLTIKNSITNFKSITDSIKNNSVANYSAKDTCLFVVNKFTTEQNYTQKRKANLKDISSYLDSKCLLNKVPIANFWGLYENSETLCNLPENFNIFVLETKKGKFWDAKHISNGKYMPNYWKHGYSKGVAIDESTDEIIYWFVLW